MQDHFTHFTPMHYLIKQHFSVKRFDCRNKYSIRASFGTSDIQFIIG